jgi:hypothetical protein
MERSLPDRHDFLTGALLKWFSAVKDSRLNGDHRL